MSRRSVGTKTRFRQPDVDLMGRRWKRHGLIRPEEEPLRAFNPARLHCRMLRRAEERTSSSGRSALAPLLLKLLAHGPPGSPHRGAGDGSGRRLSALDLPNRPDPGRPWAGAQRRAWRHHRGVRQPGDAGPLPSANRGHPPARGIHPADELDPDSGARRPGLPHYRQPGEHVAPVFHPARPRDLPGVPRGDPRPADRRYRYAFTNCTLCGPRFTIARDVPYDRPATTMAAFRMCPECEREYARPRTALPRPAQRLPALRPAARVARRIGRPVDPGRRPLGGRGPGEGAHLAVKGLGGFHLACDAGSSRAVAALRRASGATRSPSPSWSGRSPTPSAWPSSQTQKCALLQSSNVPSCSRGAGRPALAAEVARPESAGRADARLHAAPPPAARGGRAPPGDDVGQPQRRAHRLRRRRRWSASPRSPIASSSTTARSRLAPTTPSPASSPAGRRAAARPRARAAVRGPRAGRCAPGAGRGAHLKNTFCLAPATRPFSARTSGTWRRRGLRLLRGHRRAWSDSWVCGPKSSPTTSTPSTSPPLRAGPAGAHPRRRAAPPRARRQRDGRARARRPRARRRLGRHRLRRRRRRLGRRAAAGDLRRLRAARHLPPHPPGRRRPRRSASLANGAGARRRRLRREGPAERHPAVPAHCPAAAGRRAPDDQCGRQRAAGARRRAATSTPSARWCWDSQEARYEGQVAMAWNLAADPGETEAYPFDLDRRRTPGASICAPWSARRGGCHRRRPRRAHRRALPRDARRATAALVRAVRHARAAPGRPHRRLLPERASRRGRLRGPRARCRCPARASRSGGDGGIALGQALVADAVSRATTEEPGGERCALASRARVLEVDGMVASVDFWGVRKQVRLDIVDEPVGARGLRPEPRRLRHPPHPGRGRPATLELFDDLLRKQARRTT